MLTGLIRASFILPEDQLLSTPVDLDHFTGLPKLPQALADISLLARQQDSTQALGIVSLFVPPTPALYRITPEAGHHLRRALSQRVSRALREQDRLYSVSNWEWLILLPTLVSAAPLTLAMMKIRAALGDPFETLDGDRLQLDAYCGGSLWPDDGDDPIHLAQSARIARLHAASSGSGALCYQRDMEKSEAGQTRFQTALQQALSGNEHNPMRLFIQPQVDLTSGICTGAEALLRWQHADGDAVPPHHIIAALEKLGLRHSFTRWLLNQAMQSIAALTEAGIDIPLSVNLSASDLLDIELPDLVTQTLAIWEIPPYRLLLEITETMMVEETPQVTEVLRRLRQLGLTLAIDDFGTGYAGMSYLQRLPVEEVKIDQRFVRQAVNNKRDREIIASIVQLSHRLGLKVVAEGVESQETADMLWTLGCELGQGNYYSPALPLEDFIAWYKRRQVPASPLASFTN